jgi:hypothetical protein
VQKHYFPREKLPSNLNSPEHSRISFYWHTQDTGPSAKTYLQLCEATLVLFRLVSRKPKDFSSDYHQLRYYSYIDRIRSNSQHNILSVMQMEHSQGRFFLSDWRDHRANPPCLAEDYHKTVAPSNIPYRNPQPLLPVMEPATLKDSLHNSPLGHLMLSRMTPILPEAHFDPGCKKAVLTFQENHLTTDRIEPRPTTTQIPPWRASGRIRRSREEI